MKPPGLFFLLLETENGPLGSVQDEHFWIFSKAHLNMAAFPLTIYFSKKQLSKSCYEHGKIQLNTVIKRLLQLKLLSLDKIMQWVYRMFSMMLIGVNLGASFICVQKSFNTCSCRRTSPQQLGPFSVSGYAEILVYQSLIILQRFYLSVSKCIFKSFNVLASVNFIGKF